MSFEGAFQPKPLYDSMIVRPMTRQGHDTFFHGTSFPYKYIQKFLKFFLTGNIFCWQRFECFHLKTSLDHSEYLPFCYLCIICFSFLDYNLVCLNVWGNISLFKLQVQMLYILTHVRYIVIFGTLIVWMHIMYSIARCYLGYYEK